MCNVYCISSVVVDNSALYGRRDDVTDDTTDLYAKVVKQSGDGQNTGDGGEDKEVLYFKTNHVQYETFERY